MRTPIGRALSALDRAASRDWKDWRPFFLVFAPAESPLPRLETTPPKIACPPGRATGRALLVCCFVAAESALAQSGNIPGRATSELVGEAQDAVVELSPFRVTADNDRGYAATNSISGTRLDTAIKDTPFAIEVITSGFIEDVGATDLRAALRFSSGIQLQSQNDYVGNGFRQYQNLGGVNNPEMQTANGTDTALVIRGFTTDNALRDGFRRKSATDASNIERIEIVRGPAALLYGIGNFGGVVNYLPKAPLDTPQRKADFRVGSHGLARATIDVTGPFASSKGGYRVTVAAQENGDYTEHFRVRKLGMAAILAYRPWEGAEVTVDTELGWNRSSGVGFQSLRARADALGNDGRLEHAGFVAFPGVSRREMRWSGPDTESNSEQENAQIKFSQRLADGLDFLIAFNHSTVTTRSLDVNASVGNNIGPIELWSTLVPVPLDSERGDTDANWAASPVPHSIVAYSWSDSDGRTRANQARAELSYRVETLADSPWLALESTVLVGASTERDRSSAELHTLDSEGAVYNWKSVADPTPFRLATQGDGSPSLPLRLRRKSGSEVRETGAYAIYQGRFLQEKVTLLGGVRRDRNGVSTWENGYRYSDGALDPEASSAQDPDQKHYTTTQIGVSIAPIKALSFYALRSEGLTPNFSGARDLMGRPMDAVKAINKELGVKFDLFDGRLSGTVSRYRITRSGQPNGSFWWAPQTAIRRFDETRPVVYNLTDLNPDAATKYSYQDNTGAIVPLIQWNNNYAYWGDLTQLSAVPPGAAGSTATAEGLQSYRDDGLNPARAAIQQAWAVAKTAGAVTYWDATGAAVSEMAFSQLVAAGGPSSGFITLNATEPEGAAYLDAVYGYTRQAGQEHPGSDNWPGWFFGAAPDSTGFNNASQDTNSFANLVPLSAAQSDRNSGWDGQLAWSPNERLQILFSFHRNDHTILSLGQFPDYPGQQADRWAPWMFPNGQWGLSGHYGANEQYADENDTSTYSFKGLIYPGAQGMDYAKWSWSLFANWRPAAFGWEGLRIGGGVARTGPQEYASGYTHAGDALKDNDGLPLILYTDARWRADVFARFDLPLKDRDAYLQLNIDNVFDDKKQYGLLWAPGRSAQLGAGLSF